MTSAETSPARPTSVARRAVFEHALHKAAEIAALSPSSHNCQPWAVAWPAGRDAREAAAALTGGPSGDTSGRDGHDGHDGAAEDEYLILAVDHERQLTSLPAHAVEMVISCGAYWQILLRALAAQGWSADGFRFADRFPDGSGTGEGGTDGEGDEDWALGGTWPTSWSPLCAVRLRRTDEPAGSLAELHSTARARRTNRAPYHREGIDPATLAGLSAPSTAAAAGADVTVRHLVTETERADFADFVARHGGRDFSHPSAWRETHSFVRWSRADAEAHGDGFPLSHLFGPMSWPRRNAMRIALAPLTMRVLRHVGYHRVLARGLARMVRPSPAIVAMSFADRAPSPEAVVRGGAQLADYWLRATDAGLVLHPVSVVLQHDDLRAELEDGLRLPGRAFFVSRLGRPTTEFPPSPRRAAGVALRRI
ncbi:RedV protein [Streptomyces sp. NBC_00878]|uniref:RedV protein n=1 Tax=Streptomyces sp. NBC_00878 TaxID=2975854 RepID=UPI00224D6E5F|nr:RedV protein [Streptomyces sp. NBC_00878]MCX4911599.1 RedV protein [Streptomyces sp. NBC_00878]